jgi:hypothetical protein
MSTRITLHVQSSLKMELDEFKILQKLVEPAHQVPVEVGIAFVHCPVDEVEIPS